MGFQLVIAEGKEAGREFEFDQDTVLIGRTDECDVILYEVGVSRRHAQILVEGELHFIEDLGSSNGTHVNRTPIAGKQALNAGDSIAIGPVLFNFKPVELEEESADTAPALVPIEEGGAHTRIISVSSLKKSRNKAVAGLEKNTSREQREEMGRRSTTMMPKLDGPRPSAPGLRRTGRPSGNKPKLADRDSDLPRGVEVAGGGRPRLTTRPSGSKALSAADRARLLREGPVGRAKLWWAEANTRKRQVVMGVAGAVGLVLLSGLIYAVIPADAAKGPKEPEVLTATPTPYSFGLGEGVTFNRPDEKSFTFEAVSPVQVFAVVHFQSLDINSKDEVSVTVNGVEVGWLPPDTLDSAELDLELIVRANLVKRNETNTITFDNINNPPGEETWRIQNLWLETMVLPELSEDGLKAQAAEQQKRALMRWDQRDIGASNRWEAYRAYREAWLMLEALPPDRRPKDYTFIRDRMNEIKRELDRKCRELLRQARSSFNMKNYDDARSVLDHVKDYFPSRAHTCQYRAERERWDMDL